MRATDSGASSGSMYIRSHSETAAPVFVPAHALINPHPVPVPLTMLHTDEVAYMRNLSFALGQANLPIDYGTYAAGLTNAATRRTHLPPGGDHAYFADQIMTLPQPELPFHHPAHGFAAPGLAPLHREFSQTLQPSHAHSLPQPLFNPEGLRVASQPIAIPRPAATQNRSRVSLPANSQPKSATNSAPAVNDRHRTPVLRHAQSVNNPQMLTLMNKTTTGTNAITGANAIVNRTNTNFNRTNTVPNRPTAIQNRSNTISNTTSNPPTLTSNPRNMAADHAASSSDIARPAHDSASSLNEHDGHGAIAFVKTSVDPVAARAVQQQFEKALAVYSARLVENGHGPETTWYGMQSARPAQVRELQSRENLAATRKTMTALEKMSAIMLPVSAHKQSSVGAVRALLDSASPPRMNALAESPEKTMLSRTIEKLRNFETLDAIPPSLNRRLSAYTTALRIDKASPFRVAGYMASDLAHEKGAEFLGIPAALPKKLAELADNERDAGASLTSLRMLLPLLRTSPGLHSGIANLIAHIGKSAAREVALANSH